LKTKPVLKEGRSCFDFSKNICTTAKWYRGDLHAHTSLSDGHNASEQAVALIEQQQLDFIFLTEHNTSHTFLPVLEKTLFVPGIEITTDIGHFNVHGLRQPLQMQEEGFTSKSLIEI
jgi:predicted metal-dependent phosphoesterase TrpH